MPKIYDIAPDMYYHNVHLMKDCCLIPYTFGKLYGYEPIIVTAKAGEYPYLHDMPEYNMDFQPSFNDIDGWIEHCSKYITDHYSDMDILFCFGPYYIYSKLLPLYKNLRPNGKTILKLDANMDWMQQIPIESDLYKNIFSNCDLITCECSKVKKYISTKWPYKIDYVPNGFLNLHPFPETDYAQKENIILTVAEIGRNQKNHPLLLEAFALCAHLIPDWNLKLVGPVLDDFKVYMDNYFVIHPELVNRVILTGSITEKNELYSEYAKAKIFVLSSNYEGGTPNVFSEAARFGCFTICSDIDASLEFTNYEKDGIIFPVGDVKALADIFISTCNEAFESRFIKSFSSMKNYCNTYFNYENIVKKLYHLLFNI